MTSRHISFRGIPNARDLGGLPVGDGQRVRPCQLLATSALDGATESDVRALQDDFGVRLVINLCGEPERTEHPDPVHAMSGVRFVGVPILPSSSAAARLKDLPDTRGLFERMRTDAFAMMSSVYRGFVTSDSAVAGLRSFFATILEHLDEPGATLWHCSAGKDRTGIASYLMLRTLGATHRTALDDYLSVAPYLEWRYREFFDDFGLDEASVDDELARGARIMSGVDPTFLDAAVDEMDGRFGSVDGFIEDALGIDRARREALRERYLDAI